MHCLDYSQFWPGIKFCAGLSGLRYLVSDQVRFTTYPTFPRRGMETTHGRSYHTADIVFAIPNLQVFSSIVTTEMVVKFS